MVGMRLGLRGRARSLLLDLYEPSSANAFLATKISSINMSDLCEGLGVDVTATCRVMRDEIPRRWALHTAADWTSPSERGVEQGLVQMRHDPQFPEEFRNAPPEEFRNEHLLLIPPAAPGIPAIKLKRSPRSK